MKDTMEQREHERLVRRLRSLTLEMEFIGENYMGLLGRLQAGQYHDATDAIRRLVADLTQPGERP